ncbi:MAG: tRNA (adenosine(37)-N6)-threonylcarbamoyltransferase complex ATPase subunit type 1 TsaE [Candidatus Dependentiae bacterium]|jgi:tRNA threonylcarbamoyladenosine biosynthesis protein TsaE
MNKRYTEQEVPQVASQLAQRLQLNSIVTLTGPLGAGKTSLVKELLAQCGVTDEVTSPTFAYVNTYTDGSGRTIHHFDLYRLNSADEFCEAGFEEYLDDDKALVIIEWPAVVADLLERGARAARVVNVHLSYDVADLSIRVLQT